MNILAKKIGGFLIYPMACLCFAASFFYLPYAEASFVSDKLAAVVNDYAITESELQREMHQIKTTSDQASQLPPDAIFRAQVLQHMINLEVQNQAVERAGISVTDAMLEEAIQAEAVEQNQTIETLQSELRIRGIPYDLYREQIRKQIAFGLLQRQMEALRITVSAQEVQDQALYLDSVKSKNSAIYYRVEDLLIPATHTRKSVKLARQKALNALKEAQQGRSFRELITPYQGQLNDLGLRALEALPTLFLEPVKALKPGEIAGPIQAPNGFHLILLKEIVQGKRSLNEEESDVRQRMQQATRLAYQRKFLEAHAQWLHGLRAKSSIKIYDNPT